MQCEGSHAGIVADSRGEEGAEKAKLSMYQSVYVSALAYSHELWAVTERLRLWIQAAGTGFLCSMAGLSLRG